jgi:tol-pal system protein YbgF
MKTRTALVLVATAFVAGAAATPLAAADKEQRQMMADIRMLQDQNQQIQNLLASITDAIKAVNARIDEQTSATRKALADEKLSVDNLSNDVRVIREKADDTSVRLGQLSQEVDSLRQGLQQLAARTPVAPPDTAAAAAPPDAGVGAGAAPPAPATPAIPSAIVNSPQRMWDQANSDYAIGQWDLAIAGFQEFIKQYPRDDRADDAQVYIGRANLQAGKNDKAADAFDVAIRTYPTGNALPDAYYGKGIALRNLKQEALAREAFSAVVMKYPDSSAAALARQALARQQ